jgi:dTDP-4-dehydrorhamnose reductase
MGGQLLVTGYGGFVAGSVVRQADAHWAVTAVSRSPVTGGRPYINNPQFDLRKFDLLDEIFADIRPNTVIHTAAIANIDYCESHRDEAEEVNVVVTKRLAELCREYGSRMIFCSTDTVFDGKRGKYSEQDLPIPVNFYAETKVRAEQIVRKTVENSVVARLSLVLGLPVIGGGNSFLARMVADFEASRPVQMADNEIRTPVDVITLGRALLELAGNDFRGIIHLAGNSRLNRYEMALRIATRLGVSHDLVKRINSNALPGRAPRPDDASLDNALVRRVLKTRMQDLEGGLELVLASMEKK